MATRYVASPGTEDIDESLRPLLWRERLRAAEAALPRAAVEPGDVVRPGLAAERADRRRDPWWRRWENVGVGLVLALVVVLVTARDLYDAPMRFDDEGTYVSQAYAVLHGHLAPYTYWYDHPPFGWILLAGWYGGPAHLLHAPNPIASGRQAMMLVLGISVVCIYLTLRRLDARRWTAAVGCLAFGLSPLAVDMHRTVLLDNIAIMFMLAALMFSVSTSRRLVATGLCGLSMSFAILSKETLLLMLPFVGWSLWRTRRGGTRAMSLTIFLLTVVLPVLYYPLTALLKGELFPGPHHVSLWGGVMFQLVDRQSSGSIFDPHSVAHFVAADWFRNDWYVLALGAALTPLLAFNRRRWPLLGATILQTLMLVRPGYLPQPFVLVLLPLAGTSIALGLDQICTWIMRPFGRRLQPGTEGMSAPRITVAPGAMWQRVTAAVVAVALVVAAGVVLPPRLHTMERRDRALMRDNLDLPYQQAVAWIEAHVPSDRLVVADNVVWTDLVDRDHRPQSHVVWFTKLGVDSDVNRYVPTWRTIDYVVSSDILRNSTQATALREALRHSRVVSTGGSGSSLVEVRQVIH